MEGVEVIVMTGHEDMASAIGAMRAGAFDYVVKPMEVPTLLGLVESHAVFACYPLLVAALSGPVLGEKVGWRRWT